MPNPYPFTLGELDADSLNAAIKPGYDLGVTRIGCQLRRSANQSIANTTSTTILWDVEDQDTDGFIAVTSGTITIPVAGVYVAIYRGDVASLVAGGRNFATIIMNGLNHRVTFSGDEDMFVVPGMLAMAVGQTVTCNVFITDAGAPRNFTGSLQLFRTGP